MSNQRLSTLSIAKMLDGENPHAFLELSQLQMLDVISIMRKEGVLARFAYILKSNELNPTFSNIKRHLDSAIIQANRLAHFCRNEAKIINRQLSKKNITPVYLKGVAYVLLDSAPLYGRMFTDMDVLVLKKDLAISERLLFSAGWVQKRLDNYDEKYYRKWAHEIPPLIHSKRDTVIDLHHNLVPPISGRAPDIMLFLQGAIATDYGNVLRPAALTLHSIIHLFTNEEFHNAFRDINDIHSLLSLNNNEQFWQDICALAEECDFTVELYLALDCAKYFFNTRIPVHVFSRVNDTVSTKHNLVKIKLWQFIYRRSLQPKHTLVRPRFGALALSLAFVRGHLVKMPLKVLLPHMSYKLYRMAVEALFGKGFGKEAIVKNEKN